MSGNQVSPGQEQVLTLEAFAVGESLNYLLVQITGVTLYYYDPLDIGGTLVTVPLSLSWTPQANGGTDDGDNVWEAGESRIWTAAYTLPANIPLGYEATFAAELSTKDLSIPVPQNETSSPTVFGIQIVETPAPALVLTKTADQATFEGATEEIIYTFSVENTGNRDLTGLTITDAQLDASAVEVFGGEDNGVTA